MSALSTVVFVVLAVGLPTFSAVITELYRRTGHLPAARHRRADLTCAVCWLVIAGTEWEALGPTARFWAWMYGAAAYAWAWWRGGGGDSTRRALEKGTGRVTAFGSRLIVVPASA